jgi:hypothetical protein
MNETQNLQQQIDELKKEIKSLTRDKFLFPSRLNEPEKRAINNSLFIYGEAQIAVDGTAHIPISGISPNNIIMVTASALSSPATATIEASSIYAGQMEVHIEGVATDTVQYIIFLTTDKSTVTYF